MLANYIDRIALVKALRYNSRTGVFTWRHTLSSRAVKGTVAGTVSKQSGYRIIRLNKQNFHAHRAAWLYCHGYLPTDVEIDHRNGVRADNRLLNLRKSTSTGNRENQRQAKSNNVSCGVLGVHKRGSGKYLAKITTGGEVHRLGTFQTPDIAHAAYVAAKRRLHEYGTL